MQSRVPGGYQLLNRDLRVVISDQTGDVIWFGTADRKTNLGQLASAQCSTTAPDSKWDGFIESRDEQTWQFFGDSGGLRWRKIYCLEGKPSVCQLHRSERGEINRSLDGSRSSGDLPAGTLLTHDFEHCLVSAPTGVLSLRGWNLEHDRTLVPTPVWVASDPLSLKPDERLAYTTDWQFRPNGGIVKLVHPVPPISVPVRVRNGLAQRRRGV